MDDRSLGRRIRGLAASAVVLAVPALAILAFAPGAFGNAGQTEDFGGLAKLSGPAHGAPAGNLDADETAAITLLRDWGYTGRPLTPEQILHNQYSAAKRALVAQQDAEDKALRATPGNTHEQRVALDLKHKQERDALTLQYHQEITPPIVPVTPPNPYFLNAKALAQLLHNHHAAEKRELVAQQDAENKALHAMAGNTHAQRVALDLKHKMERDLLEIHYALEIKTGSPFEFKL